MASHLPCLWLECIVCCDMDITCLYLPLWNNSLTIAPTLALDDMVITFNMLFVFGTNCSSNMDTLTHCFPSWYNSLTPISYSRHLSHLLTWLIMILTLYHNNSGICIFCCSHPHPILAHILCSKLRIWNIMEKIYINYPKYDV
jgi:hypothetical protein